MKALFLINANEQEKEEIRERIDERVEVFFRDELTEDERKKILQEVDIVLGGRLSKEELESTNKLKFHQTFGTGVDRHNLKIYKEKNIILCNSHEHSDTIAEYAFSLLLAASKELLANDKLLREKGLWDYTQYPSVSLTNKTILFLGFGHIGKKVMEYCKPFDMKFIAIKRRKNAEMQNVTVYTPEKRIEAIKQADFIINSLPLTEETRNFLGKEEFNAMKKEAIIVNVGRGKTIDEEELYLSLKNKKIKGAAIDVWYNYPKRRGEKQEPVPCYPSKYPFQELDNIIMSAHRAWQTDKKWHDRVIKLVENINRFVRGEEPLNKVNLDMGY
ncbi:MAG: 2-hydroxyacid dehydrogenase [Candidatus Heimdallarchaeum aukensis]|uniref:2-hydroxyacid dehydrogenase n=1 Tax=Candidatus Heimdallarchaeum aukensis TaxID=2876573 RepID=A0A9Y1BLB8_9ARCH|nr:MAG: 2-hydroxyacid dehydrogenase [Candidatus Heimdallarchaeum aukensis]